jgi:hypothetical protein
VVQGAREGQADPALTTPLAGKHLEWPGVRAASRKEGVADMPPGKGTRRVYTVETDPLRRSDPWTRWSATLWSTVTSVSLDGFPRKDFLAGLFGEKRYSRSHQWLRQLWHTFIDH